MIDAIFVMMGIFGVYLWTRQKKNYFSKSIDSRENRCYNDGIS